MLNIFDPSHYENKVTKLCWVFSCHVHVPVYLGVIMFVYSFLSKNCVALQCGFTATFLAPFLWSETQKSPFSTGQNSLWEPCCDIWGNSGRQKQWQKHEIPSQVTVERPGRCPACFTLSIQVPLKGTQAPLFSGNIIFLVWTQKRCLSIPYNMNGKSRGDCLSAYRTAPKSETQHQSLWD